MPGGLANEDEDLQAAGLRELREEETGYAPVAVTAETVRYCGSVWDNPAWARPSATSIACAGLAATGDTHRDAGEFVFLHWVTPAWLKQAVRSGEIRDRVVVAAVAYLLLEGEL